MHGSRQPGSRASRACPLLLRARRGRPPGRRCPQVNRIKISTVNRVFCADRATRDFGYEPVLSMEEALAKTLASFQHLRAAEGGAPQQKKGGAGRVVLLLLALLAAVVAALLARGGRL